MSESTVKNLDYISLKRPYIIQPQKTGQTKGAHISLPETGVLCGIRPLWTDPKKYRLDKADIDEFTICEDCKYGLANHDRDRFASIFPDFDIKEYIETKKKEAKEKSVKTKTKKRSRRRNWSDTVEIQHINQIPSNISNELKKHISDGDDIRGFEYVRGECEGGVGKRTFEYIGSWPGWAIFEYRRFCDDDELYRGIVIPVLEDNIDAKHRQELRKLHTERLWNPAITIK